MTLPLVHKLWDKGVDIGAGVITSVFVAIIGLLFWRAKLWLDLRTEKAKLLQQKELERQHEREKEIARHAALPEKREQFATLAERTLKSNEQAAIWERVHIWMYSERLFEIHANVEMYTRNKSWLSSLPDASSDTNAEGNAHRLAEVIRSIKLPPVDLS